MKEIIFLLCATTCCVSGGAVGWPGAVPLSDSVRTAILPQVKRLAYSTRQYINAVLPSYSFGYQPQLGYQSQFGYQIPQLGVYPTYPGIGFQPVLAPSYYPVQSPLYPGLTPITPPAAAPLPPSQGAPILPSQNPAGDEDTAVVDSADFPSDQRGQDPSQGFQTPSNSGAYDSNSMPSFSQKQNSEMPQNSQDPQTPQTPQAPSVPSIGQLQQYPGFGSGFPQLPQLSQQLLFQPHPTFPQAPLQTQPSGSQFGYPSPPSDTQSLNDEDSIAVDSA